MATFFIFDGVTLQTSHFNKCKWYPMARVRLSPNPTSVTSLNGIGDLSYITPCLVLPGFAWFCLVLPGFVMDPTPGFLIDAPPGIFCDSLERASS